MAHCGHSRACGAEVTDEAAISPGSGSTARITIEYVWSKQISYIQCCRNSNTELSMLPLVVVESDLR